MTGRERTADYLTTEEVCALLKLSDRTVYDLCRKGKLPGAAKVGGVWRVERSVLVTWLKAGGDAEFGRKAEGDE